MTGFLDGLRVLDFSHMLAGPMAARRLADFGAHVVKVEPKGGEGLRTRGRPIDIVDGDHLRFHAYNAGKQSIELDLGDEADRAVAHRLAGGADVLVQNFRPDVLAKFGLGYEQLRVTNPGLIYASVSGYGGQGEWRAEPGQDLLAQARSGLMWLTGRRDDPPMPVGGVVADIAAANILAQGILAALVGRAKTGRGALVETSLLEAGVDLQIDCLPMFLNRREGRPQRSASGGAHAYVDAPYAVYRTADGFIAVAMLSEEALRQMIGDFAPPASASWEEARDLNIEALAKVFVTRPTAHWLDDIAAHKGWAAKVLDWDELIASPGFQCLEMLTPSDAPRQAVVVAAPLRFDGRRPRSQPAPRLNDHGERLRREGWG